jgi:hypothetical protein
MVEICRRFSIGSSSGIDFSSVLSNENVMNLIPLIFTFIGAYGVFLFLAYLLARVFFPTLEVEDDKKPKRIKDRNHKRLASR